MILLQQLRKQHRANQQELADLLGVTRQTYARIERWTSDINLGQAAKLAEFFDISIDEFYRDNITEATVQFDREKYKQIIRNFIALGADPDGKITKTKLAKLCYLLDFTWFYNNLVSVTGLEYRKIQQWPVPDLYFTTIEEMQEEQSVAVEQKGPAYMISNIWIVAHDRLTEDEMMWIEKIATKRKSANTKEIVDFTHSQMPWMVCYDKEIIPYGLITQEDDDKIY